MKNYPTVKSHLDADYVIKALPEVIITWNMNRYVGGVASNVPSDISEGYDVEMFPIESIIMGNRPTKGINKARIGSGVVSDDYRSYPNGIKPGRYYVADINDAYKYWTSPYPSDNSGNITKTKPQVVYSNNVSINRIVVQVENSWSSPKTFSIQTTTSSNPTSDSAWTEVANQTTVGTAWKNTGKISIYWNGTDWTGTARSDNADGTTKTKTIRGIRIVVTALEGGYKYAASGTLTKTDYLKPNASGTLVQTYTDGKNSFFDLIEIAGLLEVDLTPQVITVSDNFDMSDSSNLYPIGQLTTNQASMTLSNLYTVNGAVQPGLFSKNNTDSPYANFIEPNAHVNLAYKYYDQNGNYVDKVQEFSMYIDTWSGTDDEQVSVDMSDFSKFFNQDDNKLQAALWEDLTVSQILKRILDSIGFTKYDITFDEDRVTDFTIPIFYTDGESTVWQVLDDLAKASQTAIFFDSYGVLQVKTRDFAFSAADAPTYTFNSTSTPSKPANIISLSESIAYEPNHFTINYQTAKWAPNTYSQPVLQSVWAPDGDEVLRAAPLAISMTDTSGWLYLAPDQAKIWPYSGMVNVDGELMSYDGKVFVYYTGSDGNTKNTMVINSDDEYKTRNSKTPALYKSKNYFNGALKITERGLWNSEPKAHNVEANGYSVRQIVNGKRSTDVSGFTQESTRSRVLLASTPNMSTLYDIKLATRGLQTDTPFYNYGARFRFLKQSGRTDQQGGLVIHNQNNSEDGYYIMFRPTPDDNKGYEIYLYSKVGSKQEVIGQSNAVIVENLDAEVDIEFTPVSGSHQIRIWFNGKMVINEVVPSSLQNPANGKFGMFIRGQTLMEFEYLYGLARPEEPKMPEDFSFYDKVQTGYFGYQWDREWVHRAKDSKRRVKKPSDKEKGRFNRSYFDDFGPYVHELRQYDVKFDPSPVEFSQLYMTNDWDACCLEYNADPFGAKFLLANTSRTNAIVNGDLTIAGSSDATPMLLQVYGHCLVQADAQTINAENTDQIRRRGKIESEFQSDWIQTKAMAQALADWLNDHFSYGNENISLEVFGNPLIQQGDVVHVTYPDKNIDADFFVLGVQNEFDQGINTTLSLRRRNTVV